MSLLENHLRLRRAQCAERRRYLAELELLAQRLRADASRLQAEIEREFAAGNPVSARKLARELAGELAKRHSKLERSVAAIEEQIATAREALSAAEQELKRHELAAAQRAGGTGLSDRRRARRARRVRPAAPPVANPDRGS